MNIKIFLYILIVLFLPRVIFPNLASDSTRQSNKMTKGCVFFSSYNISEGDTVGIFIKRELSDGSLCDLPPNQLFNIRIHKEPSGFNLLLPDGRRGKEFFNVRLPVKVIIKDEGILHVEADIIEDGNSGGIVNIKSCSLSAPNNKVKAVMLEKIGINKLHLTKYKEARKKLFEQIKYDSTSKASAYYNISCSYSLEKDTSQAIKYVKMAFLNGFNKEKYALFEDKDFSKIRNIPEFKDAVTSRLRKYRESLLEKTGKNPEQTGRNYFYIAKTFLEYCDTNSFYIWLERSLQNNFHPGFRRFQNKDFSLVNKDHKLDSLLEKYFNKSDSVFFPCSEIDFKPLLAKRLRCDYLPQNLGKCTNLIELDLTRKLNKKLPNEIVNLKKLRILKILWSDLSSFPKVVTKIPSLNTLVINSAYFKLVPEEIGNLFNLDTLSLQNNLLDSIPYSIKRMDHLKTLLLSKNYISSFPEVVLGLRKLEKLNLSDNTIKSIPSSIKLLNNIRTLDLSGNLIKKLPKEIGKLKKLETLNVSLNGLSKLPESIADLTNLKFLDISFNKFDSLPRILLKLKNLKTLIIFGNRLSEKEIKAMQQILPFCRIFGEGQNSLNINNYKKGVSYLNKKLKLSFTYPTNYDLKIENSGFPKYDSSITLSRSIVTNDGENDSSSFEYKWDSILNISVVRGSFFQFAEESGFQYNIELLDSSEDKHYYYLSLWVSLGRQGMQNEVSAVSINGWYGFYGTNFTGTFGENKYGEGSGYQGLHEFFIAFAVKRFDDGNSVVVTYFDDINEGNDILNQILSSLKYSTSAK